MGTYLQRSDIETRISVDGLARLADVDMDGQEDLDTVAQAITDADARIDAALGIRWPECIGTATDLLTRLGVDLAVDSLARGPARTEEIRERATRAESMLESIAAGRIRPCGSASTPGAVGDVQVTPGRRHFPGGIY
jgi:phage gp36-like protein